MEDKSEIQTTVPPVAYVRKMDREALPGEVKARTKGMDHIYAIHGEDGKLLALVDDRQKAFVLARMNELTPVSVH